MTRRRCESVLLGLVLAQQLLAWEVQSWAKQRRPRRSVLSPASPSAPMFKVAMTNSDEESILYKDTDTDFLSPAELAVLPRGLRPDFVVVKQYQLPTRFDLNHFEEEDVNRLFLTSQNVTLPVALTLADPTEFPSLSRARKACRKGSIIVQHNASAETQCLQGTVRDRIYSGYLLSKQIRVSCGSFPVLSHKKPPFELPVIYEDDHFALVNKPAGVVVYSKRKSAHGIMSIRAALPFVLRPPRAGTYFVLRRPCAVHRLDKPTSGVLCIAKTKPAMLDLSRQFHDRIVQKTYVAIVNGIPDGGTVINARDACALGVDIDPSHDGDWKLIDHKLDEKHAVTIWRPISYVPSLHAKGGYLTLVELKPKTGRFHQLRRHMAWVCGCPIIGDDDYDGGGEASLKFRGRGLFLCSTRATLEHPFYNTKHGRSIWNELDEDKSALWLSEDDRIMVTVHATLPEKFENLLERAQQRFDKFVSEKI